jgi:hypothetical protein
MLLSSSQGKLATSTTKQKQARIITSCSGGASQRRTRTQKPGYTHLQCKPFSQLSWHVMLLHPLPGAIY